MLFRSVKETYRSDLKERHKNGYPINMAPGVEAYTFGVLGAGPCLSSLTFERLSLNDRAYPGSHHASANGAIGTATLSSRAYLSMSMLNYTCRLALLVGTLGLLL